MFDWVWNTLKSMKTAIIILLILAVASVFNLFANEFIVPTDGTVETAAQVYEHSYGGLRADLLLVFQMYNPYRSWWYTGMLGILTLSLLVCVIERTPIVWRRMTRPRFIEEAERYSTLDPHVVIVGDSGLLERAKQAIGKKHYRVQTRDDGEDTILLAGNRFAWANSGPWLVHVGFILLVIGGAMIARGELRDRAAGMPGDMLAQDESRWGFNVRVDDFQIEYYPLGVHQWVQVDQNMIGRIVEKHDNNTFDVEIMSPSRDFLTEVPAERIHNHFDMRSQGGGRLDQGNISDYIATLTVIENGQEIKTERVEVNAPLRYKGYRFYQSSFDDRRQDDQGRWMTILSIRKDRGAPFVWAGILVVSLGLFAGMYFMPMQIAGRLERNGKNWRLYLAARSPQGRKLPVGEFESIIEQIGGTVQTDKT